MAKKENKYKGYGIATQAIHTGTDYDEGTGAVRRPLHMANSYKLPDDLSQVNYSSTDLLMYSRNGNPNQHWLEEKIAAMHEADDAIVLASGVAALHALFWTLLKTATGWFIQMSAIWLSIACSMNFSIINLVWIQ
jgi:methionine-gamma-lyase